MMTPLMRQVAAVLEAELRPGLLDFVCREYRKRSGDVGPSDLRMKELAENCLRAIRLKLEQCYDLKLSAMDVKQHVIRAIRLTLEEELAREFPAPIVLTA